MFAALFMWLALFVPCCFYDWTEAEPIQWRVSAVFTGACVLVGCLILYLVAIWCAP